MTSLWQITDGKKFAQLIFSRNELIDCEFLEEGEASVIDEFLEKFVEENELLLHNHKRNRGGETRHHKYLKSSNSKEMDTTFKSNVIILQLETLHQIPEKFLKLMNLKILRKKCDLLHKSIRKQQQYFQKNEDKKLKSDLELQMENGRYEKF